MLAPTARRCAGFTLIELLITIAVAAILLAVVGPSFTRMMENQRVRSIHSQLVTDMQLARTEAAARGTWVRLTFKNDVGTTCYSMYTYRTFTATCDCLATPACAGPNVTEIRTVRYETGNKVTVLPLASPTNPSDFAFDHITGSIWLVVSDADSAPSTQFEARTRIDTERTLSMRIARSGRPTVCRPTGSTMDGVPAC